MIQNVKYRQVKLQKCEKGKKVQASIIALHIA